MSAVTGADLWPLLPRQCLLVTDASLLTVTNSSLWMDNLYIRLERSTRTPLLAVLITADELSTGLYLTGITLQVPPLPSPTYDARLTAHCHPFLRIRAIRLLAL